METPPKFPPFPPEAGITWRPRSWSVGAGRPSRQDGTTAPSGRPLGGVKGTQSDGPGLNTSTFNYVLMYVIKEVEHLKNPKYYFKYKFWLENECFILNNLLIVPITCDRQLN